MRVLVFQHLSIEHPGLFREFWRAGRHQWTTVELDEGDAIPDLQAFDLLVVMGGPMDVADETIYPWLVAEKAAIRRWVKDLERPFLGICLGHQLLADALGGEVGPMAGPEVGLGVVTLNESGQADPMLPAIGPAFEAMHWHGAEVRRLPEGAVSLASTPACGCQAIRWGRQAYGLQFHIEITAEMVAEWGAVPAYRESLEAVHGKGAVSRLTQEVAAAGASSKTSAQRFNDAFMTMVEAVSAE